MPKTPCKDHLGNTFDTMKEMCEYHNISKGAFEQRIKKNWTLKDALTIPLKDETCTDHIGNEFPSITAMCKHYGLTISTFQSRQRCNWTLKQALTTPIQQTEVNCIDHLGNTFKSIKDMCKYWNVSVTTYRNRLKQNISQEKALTGDTHIDPYGNTFPTRQKMYNTYNITRSKGRHLCTTASMIEALNIIPLLNAQIKNYRFNQKLTIIKCVKQEHKKGNHKPNYFICMFHGHEVMLPYQWIIQYCEQHLPPEKNPVK